MPKVVSLFKSKLFKVGILFLLFMAAAIIIIAMLLGKEAGSFVVRVQSGDLDRSIAVSLDKDDKNPGASLSTSGLSNMGDYSPRYFLQGDYQKLRELAEPTGFTPYDNGCLYIYTFYILNTSKNGGVGVNVTLNYSNVSNHLDEVIRVLTFYQTYNVSDPQVYQKADNLEKLQTKTPTLASVEYEHYILQPNNFAKTDGTNGVVFDNQTINIPPRGDDGYVKYTVMFWIEGDDPDSEYYGTSKDDGSYTNELYGGTIRFELIVSVKMD